MCLLTLFVVAGCPGGRVPSHDLLGPLSVVIQEVLFSMLRLARDIYVDVFDERIIGWWKGPFN